MPSIRELPTTGAFTVDGKSAGFPRNWFIDGTNDKTEVLELLLANNAILVDGCVRKSAKADPLGGGLWFGVVEYASIDPLQALDPAGTGGGSGVGGGGAANQPESAPANNEPLDQGFSFDFNASTTHITQSRRTLYAFGPDDEATSGPSVTIDGVDDDVVVPSGYTPVAGDVGKRVRIATGTGFTGQDYTITASSGGEWTLDKSAGTVGATSGVWFFIGSGPDTKQAIGVREDGSVDGCDIFTPSLTWTRTVPWGIVTIDYIKTLEDLVGTKNAAPFYGRAAGEQLLTGVSGQCGQGKRWNVTYRFASSRNRTDVEVGGGIVLPVVGGWDYVWCRYGRAVDQTNQMVLSVPKFAYVEEVYADGDFTLLGIG